MDQSLHTPLRETLKSGPDPRHARGQRYPWPLLLILIALALASGQNAVHACADWVKLRADEFRDSLKPPKGRLRSGLTSYHTLRAIDLAALEAQSSDFAAPLATEKADRASITTPVGKMLHGQALDGKEVRGSQAYG